VIGKRATVKLILVLPPINSELPPEIDAVPIPTTRILILGAVYISDESPITANMKSKIPLFQELSN
jgi:hypothetical protein